MKANTVLITGASRGIGKATAEAFAQQGYQVLINFNKSEQEAVALYDSLKKKECSVKLFKADVSKRNEVEAMINFCVNEFGRIDVLVNNAGISQEKLFVDITDED